MRIVSWNIREMGFHTSKGRKKWDSLISEGFFRDVVVLLQETKIIDEDVGYFRYLCDIQGWNVHTCCNNSRSRGVAIIGPRKFKLKFESKDNGEGRRLTISCQDEEVTTYVTCVYAPDVYKEKREWISKLKVPKSRGVVGGD